MTGTAQSTAAARLAIVLSLLVLCGRASAQFGGDAPTLLADSGGQISAIAVSVNSARRAALRNADLVSNIVNGLPSASKIYIIANDLSAFTVARNPWPDRIEFVEMPASNPITIWTQDPFLVLKSSLHGETTLLMSREFERAGDAAMAKYLAENSTYRTRQSELYFEGGNIISDEDVALIGANTIHYNALKLKISEVEAVRRFQEETGKQVLVIGPLPQPVGHIDMAITPLGRGRVAVADARAGISIVEKSLADNPDSISAFERYCEDNFFGHPDIRAVTGVSGEQLHAPALTGNTERLLEQNRRIAPILDGIARSLEDFGYTVARIPFYYGGPGSKSEDTTAGVAAYPMLSYNNVLLENSNGVTRAYLPRYGWPEMDSAAAQAWRDLGFDVRFIDGLTISAMYGGALRCSVKVLAREAGHKSAGNL